MEQLFKKWLQEYVETHLTNINNKTFKGIKRKNKKIKFEKLHTLVCRFVLQKISMEKYYSLFGERNYNNEDFLLRNLRNYFDDLSGELISYFLYDLNYLNDISLGWNNDLKIISGDTHYYGVGERNLSSLINEKEFENLTNLDINSYLEFEQEDEENEEETIVVEWLNEISEIEDEEISGEDVYRGNYDLYIEPKINGFNATRYFLETIDKVLKGKLVELSMRKFESDREKLLAQNKDYTGKKFSLQEMMEKFEEKKISLLYGNIEKMKNELINRYDIHITLTKDTKRRRVVLEF